MPEAPLLVGFVAAALIVLITPGPGVLYVVARSLGQGQRAGLVSVLGLSTGALAHVVAATVGLSAILLASATAFGVVKALGGVLVGVLNPKIGIFFLAFLPQFVSASAGPVPRQILFLGLLYVALAVLTDGAYAILAGRLRHWLGARVAGARWPRYPSGAVYIGLGVTTAFADRK